jgi:hypothetical protein
VSESSTIFTPPTSASHGSISGSEHFSSPPERKTRPRAGNLGRDTAKFSNRAAAQIAKEMTETLRGAVRDVAQKIGESGATDQLAGKAQQIADKVKTRLIWMLVIGGTTALAAGVAWIALKEAVKQSVDLPFEKKKIQYAMRQRAVERAQIAAQQQQTPGLPTQGS